MTIKGKSQWRKAITHCPLGHEYTESNTAISKKGSRSCKICNCIKVEKHRKNHSEKVLERVLNYRKRNPDKIKKWNDEKTLRQYGLTIEDYNIILNKQNNVCAICNNPCSSGRKLAVDHCHITNKVRGLLCMNCNNGLGRFKDDILLLEKASNYLKNNNNNNTCAVNADHLI